MRRVRLAGIAAPFLDGRTAIVDALVQRAKPANIRAVMVDGRKIYKDGHFVFMTDKSEVHQKIEDTHAAGADADELERALISTEYSSTSATSMHRMSDFDPDDAARRFQCAINSDTGTEFEMKCKLRVLNRDDFAPFGDVFEPPPVGEATHLACHSRICATVRGSTATSTIASRRLCRVPFPSWSGMFFLAGVYASAGFACTLWQCSIEAVRSTRPVPGLWLSLPQASRRSTTARVFGIVR